MASSSNLYLAIIPFDNQERLVILPAVLYIDSYGITRHSLMEDASVQGEGKDQRLKKRNINARSKGEHILSSQDRGNSSGDGNIPLVEMLSQRRSRFKHSSHFCQPLAMILPEALEGPSSTLSAKVPVRVTWSLQLTRDAALRKLAQ